MSDIWKYDLPTMKSELITAHRKCSERRLLNSAKWAAEMSQAVKAEVELKELIQPPLRKSFVEEFDKYTLATTYFDLKEYGRAAQEVEHCQSYQAYFLHVYGRYLADEKKRLDNASDSMGPGELEEFKDLKLLHVELQKKHMAKELDGFGLYLYGVILRKLDLNKTAVEILVESVTLEPLHWGAWQELALLITDREMLTSLELPEHWVKQLFFANVYLELQLNEEPLKIYQLFLDNGFSKSKYIISQIAVAYHNMREVDQAVAAFTELQVLDPYRLENMDIYSNLLYVKEMEAELAHLAHRSCDIDKYRVETCCVIGNYYSLRGQHEKAVLYFQRALKLNPHYLSSWTLMGHEYMEMKNTSAAIQSYRQAIEVNKRDFRAWYGLGQTYEILKMPNYSLYYYMRAQLLRPSDSRMVVALGECYEKLDRLVEAKKCFWKAHSVGDLEGMALLKLAKLYEKLNEEEQAASAYLEYINKAETQGFTSYEEQGQAYRYLANYYLARKQWDDAYAAAHKCAEFTETREEAKTLLRTIQNERGRTDADIHGSMDMDASTGSITMERHSLLLTDTPLGRLSPTALRFTP